MSEQNYASMPLADLNALRDDLAAQSADLALQLSKLVKTAPERPQLVARRTAIDAQLKALKQTLKQRNREATDAGSHPNLRHGTTRHPRPQRMVIDQAGVSILPEVIEPIHLYAAAAMSAFIVSDRNDEMNVEETVESSWRMALAMDAAEPDTE